MVIKTRNEEIEYWTEDWDLEADLYKKPATANELDEDDEYIEDRDDNGYTSPWDDDEWWEGIE